MKRTHALLIVLAVAMAAVAGTFAALRSSQLRANAAAPKVSAVQIQQQIHSLDRAEAALRAQLRRQPPALPAVPHATPQPVLAAPAPSAPTSLASAPAPRVTYVRPKPIIRIVHRHGGESGDDGERTVAASSIGSHLDD
jgi:hypothetical protein